MSLFTLDNILLNESSNPSIIDIDHIGYIEDELRNQSFVQEGYNFILEMGRDYMNAEKTFYLNILGSCGDDNIITESFDGFFDKIKDAIRKFIEWIKKIFKQFVLKINQLFQSEKYIKKNSKLLNKFDSRDEFEFNGYEFTKIDKVDVPSAVALSAFEEDSDGKGYLASSNWYSDGYSDLNMEDDSTKDARTKATTEINGELDKKLDNLNANLDDFYDKFRGRVIGEDSSYDSSEYSEKLFELFRNDENTPSNITIDSTFVMDAYRRFDKYKDTIKAIEKTQKDIIKDYEALEKYLDKLIKLNKEGKNTKKLSIASPGSNDWANSQIDVLGGRDLDDAKVYDTSTFDKMNNYLKVQSSKVNQMCSIHTQAFSAKLEAAKDCFKQDKKILYKALNQIIKRSNKSDY